MHCRRHWNRTTAPGDEEIVVAKTLKIEYAYAAELTEFADEVSDKTLKHELEFLAAYNDLRLATMDLIEPCDRDGEPTAEDISFFKTCVHRLQHGEAQ